MTGRYKRLDITPELLVELFKDGSQHAFRVTNGLPADARVVGATFTGEFDSAGIPRVSLVVQSASYEETPEGTSIRDLFQITIFFEQIQ